jgi:Holliday junction DNA helicase RuvB
MLNAVVGQRHVVEAAEVALAACHADGARFPHTLLAGPPGLGKSLLVQILARELGVALHETLGQNLNRPSDVAALLLEAEAGEIVFVDESDELSSENQTLFYRALAERKLFLSRGKSGRSSRILPLEDFAVIFACNHENRIGPSADRAMQSYLQVRVLFRG